MTRTKSPKYLATHVLLPILALAATALMPAAATAGTSSVSPQADPASAYVPGELIVRYTGEEIPETIEIPAGANPVAAAERVEDQAGIAYATPNYVARISGWTPDDIGVNPPKPGKPGGWQNKQWNFLPCLSLCHGGASVDPQSLGGMNVTKAWRHLRKAGRPGASGVKVAVLDTGVAYRDHGNYRKDPDLNPSTFLPGYDFVDRDRLPLDRNGHGTHVSSTIAQATDNRFGLTGIAYRAKLIPVRVMDANGFGTTANVIKGIRWATDHGARVISMSLNFACGASIPPLEEALRHAHSKGVVLVGSSGNKGAQTCPSLPATAPQVISVGGTTESGCVANYTFKSVKIDLAAPGGGSASSGCPSRSPDRPILQYGMLTIGYQQNGFAINPGWKGTSMAAAHVAGAAAMVIASDAIEKKGPSQVRQRLLDTARLPAFAKGYPESGFGAGIINLGKAVDPNYK